MVLGMNVNLGPVFDQFVADLLSTGLYQSQSEVLREGLRLLKEREELKQLQLTELRREIAIGSEQADRDEFIDGGEVFAQVRKRSSERKRAKGLSVSSSRRAPSRISTRSGTILPTITSKPPTAFLKHWKGPCSS